MSNPGPAVTSTVNYQTPTMQQAQVLVAFIKGLVVSAAGDTVIPMTGAINTFVPTVVLTTNANVTMATATVGIYTGPGQTGTAVLTTAALTGQTTNAFAYVRNSTAVAAQVFTNGYTLYVNVGTTVAGGVVDLYLYGYNVS